MRHLVMLIALSACASTTSVSDDTDGGETDTDTDVVDTDDGEEPAWELASLEFDEYGFAPRLAVGGDDSAYGLVTSVYALENDLECSEGRLTYSPTSVLRIDLDGGVELDEVGSVLVPDVNGDIALAVGEDGAPWIAAGLGEALDGFAYCGAHDLALGQSARALTPRVSTSDEAPRGDALDAGRRVGMRPTLAVDADGEPVIVYEDRHDGTGTVDVEIVRGETGAPSILFRGESLTDDRQLLFDGEGKLILRTEGRFRRLDGAGGDHTLSGTSLGALADPTGGLIALTESGGVLTAWRQTGDDLTRWTSATVPVGGAWLDHAVLSDGRLVLARSHADGFEIAWEATDGTFDAEAIDLPPAPCQDLQLALSDDRPVVLASCEPAGWDYYANIVHAAVRREGL